MVARVAAHNREDFDGKACRGEREGEKEREEEEEEEQDQATTAVERSRESDSHSLRRLDENQAAGVLDYCAPSMEKSGCALY